MNSSPPPSTRYIPALTGVRAIAAWMVFVHHFNPFDRALYPWLHNLSHVMHTGVSVFFVLSGFLIWSRYHDATSWGPYFQNRFARIVPLYLVLTTITFLVVGSDWPTFALNVLLLKGYFGDLILTGIAQGWTLTAEETFYALAPLLMMMLGSPKQLAARVLMLSLLLFAAGMFLASLGGAHLPYRFVPDWQFMLTYTFFGRVVEFMSGMAMGMIVTYAPARWAALTSRPGFFGWVSLLTVITLVVMSYFAYSTEERLINNFLLPIPLALMLGYLATRETFIGGILGSAPVQLFGKSSYAFYLIHVGVIQVWLADIISNHTLVLFVLLQAVAVGLYVGIERPLQLLLRSKKKMY